MPIAVAKIQKSCFLVFVYIRSSQPGYRAKLFQKTEQDEQQNISKTVLGLKQEIMNMIKI